MEVFEICNAYESGFGHGVEGDGLKGGYYSDQELNEAYKLGYIEGEAREKKNERLNEQKRKEFEEAARPLMQWLSKNCHPHMKVIVDSSQAEMLEGYVNFVTDDYILD